VTELDLRAELAALHPSAFAWAARCCRGDRAEGEDVLHHTYAKVLEGTARFEGRSTFRTWLFSVIERTARDQRRRGWMRLALLRRWWSDESAQRGESGAEGDEEPDQVRSLRVALGMLSRRQQGVLHLVFYQGFTIQAAAEVMGMQVGTARTHYERGKDRLRRLLLEAPTR
jgi:RNA polymerase sigma factor (sigma-70 family)